LKLKARGRAHCGFVFDRAMRFIVAKPVELLAQAYGAL
jgi:hypothetical protein